jgi:hypothetical protein
MIKITKKSSPAFAIKTGIVIIFIFILLGLLFKFSNLFQTQDHLIAKTELTSIRYSNDNPILVPIIQLKVKDPSREKEWVESLRQELNGRSEVSIEHGRIDIVTDTYAIEVEFFHKWQEGLGQALHYGDVSGKIPTLALIEEDKLKSDYLDRLKYVEGLCLKKGVKLLLLKQAHLQQ